MRATATGLSEKWWWVIGEIGRRTVVETVMWLLHETWRAQVCAHRRS